MQRLHFDRQLHDADACSVAPQQYFHGDFVMRKAPQNKRRGFTLVEVVVTVGIIAALAAVVYPTVVKQFDSADPARAAEDLNNIRTGIEVFSVNVRPHQPKDLEDLTNTIQTAFAAEDSTALGAAYSAADVANWNGPYLGLSILSGTD